RGAKESMARLAASRCARIARLTCASLGAVLALCAPAFASGGGGGSPNDPYDPPIDTYGYPDRPSVVAGGVLTLHVSTPEPSFRVDFYRQGVTLQLMGTSDYQPGSNPPDLAGDDDFNWPAYDYTIPSNWP